MKRSTVLPTLVLIASILVECYAVYTAKPCDGTLTSVCTDCDMIKLCIDNSVDTANPSQKCPTSLPYCSMSASVTGAVCQKTPDLSITDCAAAAPKFKCTGVGYFADAYSCQTYYYCEKPAATAVPYSCPDGYKFSPKVNDCVTSATACPTFACNSSLTDAVYQPLLANTQYYVFCSYDRTATPPKLVDTYVLSCGEGATFNPTTQKCVFTCPKDGLYANTAYPKQYYQCYLSAGKLIYKDLVCAATQKFDPMQKRCIAA